MDTDIFEQFPDRETFDKYWNENYQPVTYEDVREAFTDFVKSADGHIYLSDYEEKGLISRQTCASDRRAKRIKLTEKAAPIITEMEAVITKTRGEILSGVSPAELEMLISLIARLEQNIHELQSRD